ncbi:MAG: alpha amylase N-terminal ig-like domain-containing protein, partial [Lachnospiraceae bacterium]
MNKQALFCDGTQCYVIPEEPKENEKVIFRFRTAKDDVDQVNLVTNLKKYPLYKERTTDTFDYYFVGWVLGKEPFRYYFEIKKNEEVCYYNRCGVSREIVNCYDFEIVPGFSTPEWAKGAVMYQIFVDRFYNGDITNDVESDEYIYIGHHCKKVTDWNKPPDKVGIREFYGGDLQGVLDKLDYLKELGVEVVYFNPLFVSPSNHKYDIQDYDYIDPHYGKIVKDGGSVLPESANDNLNATKYQIRTTNLENLEASNQL